MKKTRTNTKYIPEYVLIDGKEKMFSMLEQKERFAVMAHCKSVYSVDARPNYKDIVTKCMSIMKFGCGFNMKDIEVINQRFSKYIIQPLIKDAQGGGQGGRGWGILHLNPDNLVDRLLRKYNILDEFKELSKEKQLSRIQKFIGPMDQIIYKPRVLVTNIESYEGLIKGRQSWMDLNFIPFGAKTTGPVKGLVVPMTDMEEKLYKDYDLVIPNGENKLNLSAEKLSMTIMLNRENIPANRYSRNLITSSGKIGRMPRHAFDLQAHLNVIPRVDLTVEKAFYETGKFEPEFIEQLFGYTDKEDKLTLRNEGKLIMAGANPFGKDLINETLKSLLTMIKSKLEGRIPGIYGTAMPLEMLPKGIKRKTGYVTRFPWVFPIMTEYAIYEHCVFVPEALMKVFGGDFDGDQVAIYHRMSMEGLPTWKNDSQWLTGIMSAPDKKDVISDKSIEDVMGSQIEQYTKCGQIYNTCKIIEECARMEGWSRHDIFSLGAKLTAQVVQPYINGFKYAAEEGELPTIEKIAEAYGVPLRWKERATMFFNGFRTSKASIPRIAKTAKLIQALPTSPMYYERLGYIFIDWILCEEGQKHVQC